MTDPRREALLKEYGEVSKNFSLLTDIRFKLLAFLPLTTAVTAAGYSLKKTCPVSTLIVSLFGLVVTFGLVTYNARNNQLYNELVGRASSIERSLGLTDGAFANRPQPWLAINVFGKPWKVDHGNAVETIYAATVALWLTGVFGSLLVLLNGLYLLWYSPWFVVADPWPWFQLIGLGLAVLLTTFATCHLRDLVNDRKEAMRIDVVRSMIEAVRVVQGDLADLCKAEQLMDACTRLRGDGALRKTKARAEFFAGLTAKSFQHFVSAGSKNQEAAQLVALLTDFPARWILDTYTNRPGELSNESVEEIAKEAVVNRSAS